MQKTIIAIAGDKQSGKSTLARELYQRLNNCMIIPFAGVPKQCVEIITGVDMSERQPDGSYDYSQKQKAKTLPGGSTLGVFIRDFAEAVRTVDKFIWADAAIRIIDEAAHQNFIVPDIRMPQEYDLLHKMDSSEGYNVYICRLVPDKTITSRFSINDGRESDHNTERALDGHIMDDTFSNSYGLHNLQRIADEIIRKVRG